MAARVGMTGIGHPAVATMNIRVFSLAHFVEGTSSPPRRALGRDQGCLAVNDGSE